jgi:hypothetical protein
LLDVPAKILTVFFVKPPLIPAASFLVEHIREAQSRKQPGRREAQNDLSVSGSAKLAANNDRIIHID